MLRKDLTFAFRNLKKNKLIAAINVLGLTIGISSCLVIFLIVNFELSFDSFQPDRDRIFRVYSQFSGVFSGTNRGVPTAFTPAIRDEFKGVEAVANFHTFASNVDIKDKQGDKSFERYQKVILTVPDYFKVFSYYEWLEGSADGSLSRPQQVVLTESRARTYFGDIPLSEIIGREVIYKDSLSVTVSGIVKDIREKTDLDFTDFISFATIESTWLKNNYRMGDWGSTNSSSQLFIKAMPNTTRATLNDQMKILSDGYVKANPASDWKNTPQLQSLKELHFNTTLGIFDNSRSVAERSTLLVLTGIALLLLAIATINFINLETAQASRRAREVGVRKVLGSSRFKLIRQFLIESFALTFLAIILSISISALVLGVSSDLFPPGLQLDPTDPMILLFLSSCLVVVTLLAGLYPAFVLSSTQPVVALKNLVSQNSATSRSSFLRKGLTVFQFSISQVLIIATLAIGWQINFLLNKDLGFSTERIIAFDSPWWDKPAKRDLLRNELQQIPEIEALSLHGDTPSSGNWSSATFAYDNGKEVLKHSVYQKQGDTAYLSLYNIHLIAGRNLQQTDTAVEYLINETYMKLLGFTDPRDALGKMINHKPIVGVVRDFNSRSLHNPIDPMVIYNWAENYTGFGMRIHAGKVSDMKPVIDKLEAAWKKIYPDQKFEYSFMDDTIKRFYETEQRTGKLAKAATGIAVLISCLGLFGLSSFTVIQRTKEIGIRKVLGATVNSIVILLSKDFLLLVTIAFVISAPVAYYVADKWLQDFAYKIDMGVWIFLIAGLSSIITAFITISFRTIGAAKADPVKSLRYE